MQDKSKFEELLISYLANELNSEDEEFVVEWINFNEQNRQYFEELQTIWQLTEVKRDINNIDVSDEWKTFKQTINNKQQENLLFEHVQSLAEETVQIYQPRRRRFKNVLLSTAISASVIFIVGIAFGLFEDKKPEKQALAKVGIKKAEAPLSSVTHEKNTSKQSKRIVLSDGSEVTLFAQSEISYHEPFVNSRRDISLRGKAEFKVAKDKTKPFTVFSGDISTTALGTRFTVTAYEAANNIIVKLYEGKVVVKPGTSSSRKLKKDYYLLSGQQLIYSKLTSIVKLQKFEVHKRNAVKINYADKAGQPDDVPAIPLNEKGSWYMFNNQSLRQVFEQLQNLYDVEILYSKKQINNKYFIGKFDKSDSIENVLKQITTLNNLRVDKKNNKFIIIK
jgi:ferric-dicitrate binding protein FerR (iron transport regulator)